MAPPQSPRRKPDTDPPEAPPTRRFRHVPLEPDEAPAAPRYGHGSGCIPVFLFRFSLLTVLIWLACLLIAGGLARLAAVKHKAAPAAASAGSSSR
jgi:hypothetical protein